MTAAETTPAPTIVWLRDDLRVADNPALVAAVERGGPVVVLYLLDEVSPGIRPLGSASRWWLHHSLEALARAVAVLGGRLVLRRGAAAEELPRLVNELAAGAVVWNRRYGASRDIDAALKIDLRGSGVEVESFAANLLFEPWTITTGDGNPYRVFTPFWRACLARGVARTPLSVPSAIVSPRMAVASDSLDAWKLRPTAPDWSAGIREKWTPGEDAAHDALENFATDILENYHRRDEPGIDSTSGLSPYLRFGELSPFQVWHRLHAPLNPAAQKNAAHFLSEIGWREFNWNILFFSPELHTKNYRPAFDAFPWRTDRERHLRAWQHGHTGIPLVDAGMRELWQTGVMHNRIRMVTASFLIKNLLIDWRVGEAWFWDTLVDADEASNPANWQWVAGSGADAAPYFRVFNPLLQADKFDKQRRYVTRWVPEVDDANYARPIVDLKLSRQDALGAYDEMKAATA